MRKPVSLSLSESTIALIADRCPVNVPRSRFVDGVLAEALGGHQQGGNAREAEEPDKMVKREPPAPPRAPDAAPWPASPMLWCPVAGCEFRAVSPNAVCGAHGRKVQERKS